MPKVFRHLYKNLQYKLLSDNVRMSKNSDTLARLLTLIQEQHHLDIKGVGLTTGLADVGLDSLAVAELMFSIEETFKVDLGDIAAEALPATVGEVVNLIENFQSKKTSA
jgi:acyl carrier protein